MRCIQEQLKSNQSFPSIRLFDFTFVSSDDISEIITSLDSTKIRLVANKSFWTKKKKEFVRI